MKRKMYGILLLPLATLFVVLEILGLIGEMGREVLNAWEPK